MFETSYSTTKRSLGSAVRAQFWYREFREINLMFTISNTNSFVSHYDHRAVPLFNTASIRRALTRTNEPLVRYEWKSP